MIADLAPYALAYSAIIVLALGFFAVGARNDAPDTLNDALGDGINPLAVPARPVGRGGPAVENGAGPQMVNLLHSTASSQLGKHDHAA